MEKGRNWVLNFKEFLIESQLKMNDNTFVNKTDALLVDIFHAINKKYFNNKLPAIKINWVFENNLNKSYLGNLEIETNIIKKTITAKCINLNYNKINNYNSLRNTLIHELIHYYVFLNYHSITEDQWAKVNNMINNNYRKEEIDVSKPNHWHGLVKSCNFLSPAMIVNSLKSYTSFHLWKEFPSYLKQFYWKKHNLWTRGYFYCSIGNANDETIKKYIENQG